MIAVSMNCPAPKWGLSSTPCVNDKRGQHLNISVFPVLFFVFLVKTGFDLIGKEVVIMKLTRWRIAVLKRGLVSGSKPCHISYAKASRRTTDVSLTLTH